MSRASWGGQQDLSGLFSSLINENFQQIQAGVNEAVSNANDEQAAKDQKTQAKWTAGKISDEEWLDYIRSRIADSTDPQERGQWQQILLQNQDAISDAQWETRFQQNKITVGQLLAHYNSRMVDVRHNSPAYRDLVGRKTELIQFQRSGGVYYRDQYGSSGGGGRSSGGSRSSGYSRGSSGYRSGSGGGGGALNSLQKIINKGLRGGPIDAGYLGGDIYNTRGPDVLGVEFPRPATPSKASLYVAVTDGLIATQKQLNAFFDYLHNNPTATQYTLPGTGQLTPINEKTVRAYEDQWLRVTTTLVNVYHKKGDHSEQRYYESMIGPFVTQTMQEHNARFNQPNEDNIGMWTKRVFARLNAASTPQERADIAAEAGTTLDKYIQKRYPQATVTELTPERVGGMHEGADARTSNEEITPTTQEDQLPAAIYESHASLRAMYDVIAHPDQYTDEDIDAIFDDSLDKEDIGTGANRIHLADLMGNGGPTSTIGDGALGAGDFRVQFIGLRAADMIQRGIATPDDFPPNTELYTYQWNSSANRMEPTVAVATPSPDGSFDVVPGATDASGNVTPAQNAVKYMSNINGQPTEVWTPVIDATPASGYIYRFGADQTVKAGDKQVSFKKGDLVPSSALESLGAFNVNAMLQQGMLYKDAPPGIRQADIGGHTWYFDLRLNTWSPTPPWNIETDKTDPNAIFVVDPPYKSGTSGYTVDETKVQGASAYIAAPIIPGTEGFVMPYDQNMNPQQMQSWLEGEIAAGRIIPSQYRMVDAEGNPVNLTMDQLMTSYYDPALEARLDTMRREKAQRSENMTLFGTTDAPRQMTDVEMLQQAKQEFVVSQYDRTMRDRATAINASRFSGDITGPDPLDKMRAMQQQAARLGISTGVLAPPARNAPAQVSERMDDTLLRSAALIAAANRLRIAKEPRLEPLPADPVKPVVKPLKPPPVPKVPPLDLIGRQRTEGPDVESPRHRRPRRPRSTAPVERRGGMHEGVDF